jgi:hypothetical protein
VVHELRVAKSQRDYEQSRARQFQDDIQIHLKQKAELATARDAAHALADSRADEIKDLRNSMETDPDREAERDSAAKRIARLQKKLDASNLKYQDLLASVGSKSLGGVAPAGASSADMHKVLNRPGAFDGESTSTISVVDWLVVVKHYFRAVKQPRAKWVTIASSYLRGEAMRFWANRKKSLTKPDYRSWLVFKTALLERFDSENTAVSARLRLDALSQGDLAMPKFVHKFDLITSYIPDMSEADMIHRFLEAVRGDLKLSLSNNPNTGKRWTDYSQLRQFALNLYPTRPLLGGSGGVSHTPTGDRGGVSHTPSTGDREHSGRRFGRLYKNAANRPVLRTQDEFQAIVAAQVCGFCYREGHQAGECTAVHPAAGSPPVV